MKSTLVSLAIAALSMGTGESFTTPRPTASARLASTSLSMASDDNTNHSKKNTFAASAVAAAYLLANVVSFSDAAFAMDGVVVDALQSLDITQSSSVMIAARSGGRAGGRAAPRMMSRPSSSSTTRVINQRTTVIAPPPIVMGGGYGGYGYGGYYDPTPGIGTFVSYLVIGDCFNCTTCNSLFFSIKRYHACYEALNLGFSAVNAIGNGMRESRQNEMIYQERAELSASREMEAEMAARIRQLELMQMQQAGGAGGGQIQQQQQPQIIIAQPAPVPAQ